MNGRFRATYGDRFRSRKLRSAIPLITLHRLERGLVAQTAPDIASSSRGGSGDWSIGFGLSLQTSCRRMIDRRNDSPRRYFVDGHGRRVLVGLTIEETVEFERLDGLAILNGGNVFWQEPDLPAANPQKRWLELYTKHDSAWAQWMAERRQPKREILPFLN